MKIFTTINPYGNHDAQKEALSSWCRDYDVYSTNTKEEIEVARELYPQVNFIETDYFFEYGGKKLIRLNSILDSIKSIGPRYCAIVNSDIISSGWISPDKNMLKDGIIVATRWEIDGDKDPYPFNNGYDLFVFDTKYLELFRNANYVIGMPWWDFWIPIIALKAGLKVYHIKNRLIHHRTHPTNYDSDVWIKFGEFLYSDIMLGIMKNPVLDVNVYDFCKGCKIYIEKNLINIKAKFKKK